MLKIRDVYHAVMHIFLYVCLFGCSHMETSPLQVKGCKFNFYLCSALMAIEQWWFFCMHTYCDTGHLFKMSSPRTRDTHTYCRAFSSGAVTTWFFTFYIFELYLNINGNLILRYLQLFISGALSEIIGFVVKY